MGNIMINPIFSDLNKIVSSGNGSVGDNSIALSISDLRHNAILGPTSSIQNMDDFYRFIIGGVGNGGWEANGAVEGQTTLVNSADNFRQSIMNVSMDEEMSNMITLVCICLFLTNFGYFISFPLFCIIKFEKGSGERWIIKH